MDNRYAFSFLEITIFGTSIKEVDCALRNPIVDRKSLDNAINTIKEAMIEEDPYATGLKFISFSKYEQEEQCTKL